MTVRFNALVRGAFGGSNYARQDISVDTSDGTVRVWDDVAGHYTPAQRPGSARRSSRRLTRPAAPSTGSGAAG